MCCEKCTRSLAIIVLLFGILFLLRDLNVWAFWNIQWWTIGFVLAGLAGLCHTSCPMCVEKAKKQK